MGNLRKVVLFLIGVHFLRIQAADKYTDENRPYEFGFTIEGEQHRHEKKDENGIVMGEFGFITADGVYHVTVYATDENGNFKILSMKNIRVKPYPTSPGALVKNSKPSTLTAPHKDSVPESTNEEKITKKQVASQNEEKITKKQFASPAKSCSHCSLPTTTTTTAVSPAISKISAKNTNNLSTENYNPNQNNENFSNKNAISLQNISNQQKDYNSKTHQSNPQTAEKTYLQEEQNNKNSQNENLLLSQKLDNQEPHIDSRILQSYPETNIDNQSDLQQAIVSNNPIQTINPDEAQYSSPQNRPLSKNEQISVSDVRQNNPSESNVGVDLQPNQNPISRNLQVPLIEDYLPNQALPQNKQSNDGPKNYQQNNLNSNNNNYSEGQSFPQELNYDHGSNIKEPNQLNISSPPIISSRQALLSHNEGDRGVASGNPKGERTPKSFGDFIQQSIGPEEIVSTGPNLYRPSLPKASELSDKPVLLAAQIQKVDKNTNIYNKNPGERDGLPEGITTDDITNLLYTFNYTVGFHGHHEKGYSNGAKEGYYYVTGRNGVRTRVDYVADEKGFRPKITQEILDIISDEVPKPETEKDEKYGLKGYEFKWLYFPLDAKPI